jgi:hypothetical protein
MQQGRASRAASQIPKLMPVMDTLALMLLAPKPQHEQGADHHMGGAGRLRPCGQRLRGSKAAWLVTGR